jgi:hypothetical protein
VPLIKLVCLSKKINDPNHFDATMIKSMLFDNEGIMDKSI